MSSELVVYNWIAAHVGFVGIVCNILWITVYSKAYKIHKELPFYPSKIDLLLVIQALSDLWFSIIIALFNTWLITINSNLNNAQLSDTWIRIIFGMSGGSAYFSYSTSFGILAVIARLSKTFLMSSKVNNSNINHEMNQLAVRPAAVVVLASLAIGIVGIFSKHVELKTAHTIALTQYNRYESFDVIFLLIAACCVQLSSTGITIYYYRQIVKYTYKMNQDMKSISQEQTTSFVLAFRRFTGLNKLNRLAVCGISMTAVLLVATTPGMIATMYTAFSDGEPPFVDFICTILPFSYTAFLNGFVVCNCSLTYQKILKDILLCHWANSLMTGSARNSATFADAIETKINQRQLERSAAVKLDTRTIEPLKPKLISVISNSEH